MIELTEKSANKLRQVLSEQGVTEDVLLRVGIKAGGCSGFTYVLDLDSKPTKFDKFFESFGIGILCDKKSLLYIKGLILDWNDDLMNRGFVFNNPKAKSSCGCKTSFMIDSDDAQEQEFKPSWM